MRATNLLMLCALASGFAAAASSAPSAAQAIPPLMAEMMLAANAHDTDRFMAAYVHASTLAVTFDDMTMHGWQVVRDQQLQWWDNGKSKAVYHENAEPEIIAISDTVAATLQAMTATDTTPTGEKSVKLVVTSIWKKLPEGWRIVVAHESLIH